MFFIVVDRLAKHGARRSKKKKLSISSPMSPGRLFKTPIASCWSQQVCREPTGTEVRVGADTWLLSSLSFARLRPKRVVEFHVEFSNQLKKLSQTNSRDYTITFPDFNLYPSQKKSLYIFCANVSWELPGKIPQINSAVFPGIFLEKLPGTHHTRFPMFLILTK